MPFNAVVNAKHLAHVQKLATAALKDADSEAKELAAYVNAADTVEEKHRGLIGEFAVAIGDAVQDARDMGLTGKRLQDYDGYPAVKKLMGEWDKLRNGAIADTGRKQTAAERQHAAAYKSVCDQVETLDETISDQEAVTKKEKITMHPTVAELRALLKKAKTIQTSLENSSLTLNMFKDYVAIKVKQFDKELEVAFGKTRANRQVEEDAMLLDQFFEVRKMKPVLVKLASLVNDLDLKVGNALLLDVEEDADNSAAIKKLQTECEALEADVAKTHGAYVKAFLKLDKSTQTAFLKSPKPNTVIYLGMEKLRSKCDRLMGQIRAL